MRISIHQPNFFPYVGFFNKMKESDIFVILTYCQFEKNGYQNRFNAFGNWYTMSVRNKTEMIRKKAYLHHDIDWRNIKRRLPDYDLAEFDDCIFPGLVETNVSVIERIAHILKISTVIDFDFETELTGTARLVEICKKYGADEYLAGPSGPNYIDSSIFEDAGIKVIYQKKQPSDPIIHAIKEAY